MKWNSESESAVNLPIFKKSEYRSWDMRPWVKAKHGFGDPTPVIKTNGEGLRGSHIPKEKTKKRILLLGDSFVFGMGANQHQTIDRYLNIKYTGEKNIRVMNGGVIGHTVDDAFLYLKNDGAELKPDIVVYHFFVGNDITELRRHNQTYNENGDLIKTEDIEHEINSEGFLRKKGKKEPKSYFLFWLDKRLNPDPTEPTLTWPVFFADNDFRGDSNLSTYWGNFFKILKQMDDYCKENNIKFVVNIIPMDVQVSEKYWDKYPGAPFGKEEFEAKRPQKRIISFMKENGIEYIDLLPIFQDIDQKEGTVLYFEKDPHFNRWGNMWAANSIYLYLINNNYL